MGAEFLSVGTVLTVFDICLGKNVLVGIARATLPRNLCLGEGQGE